VRRREFITLVGGGAAAWPLAARAQQASGMRRIGVLMGTAAEDAESKAELAGFRDSLGKLGWVEGNTIHIDYRFVANPDQYRERADRATSRSNLCTINTSCSRAAAGNSRNCDRICECF
jgi:putative ABC transport system substrate-binding protein